MFRVANLFRGIPTTISPPMTAAKAVQLQEDYQELRAALLKEGVIDREAYLVWTVVLESADITRGPIHPRARLDAEGTAQPLTRIVSHPQRDWCLGPGMAMVEPEYEDQHGHRTPLTPSSPSSPSARDGKTIPCPGSEGRITVIPNGD